MNKVDFVLTSESVTEGHPDKVCDQISDAVLDEVLRQDKNGRVACETFITVGLVIVGGEITTTGYVNLNKLVRTVLKDIGYTDIKFGFNYQTCAILNAIGMQSPDIALGVDKGGAGDQGAMIGYACRESPELMPLPIILSHKLTRRLTEVRKKGILDFIGPDGKSQVTIQYKNGKPVAVKRVVIAIQHTEDALDKSGHKMSESAKNKIKKEVIIPVLGKLYDADKTICSINETGKFVIGGPQSDTGMTGRKIIVDTYGANIPHGGGAFSGKDPTKVDRSAAYMARYLAKNIVAAKLAEECMVQLAYVIGLRQPVSIMVSTKGTGKISDEKITGIIRDNFDLSPLGIINYLKLRRPIYGKTAAYGHFGRNDKDFTWEKTDKKELFKMKAR
ncbi:MAG: methionine adenosyltransferase [Candidatus Ratteibacteria bacterium]|nr:methionine adenosyltransferase [Candidatus Ratteibacteria bacterium]